MRRMNRVAFAVLTAGTAFIGIGGIGTAGANGCTPYLGSYGLYGASCFVGGFDNNVGVSAYAAYIGVDATVAFTVIGGFQAERVYTEGGHTYYQHCTDPIDGTFSCQTTRIA